MIELLKQQNTSRAVVATMKKLCYAKEPDNFRVPQAMCKDLLSGMTEEQITAKPYEYVMELFYYTKPQYVPKNDPNWSIVDIVNINDYFDIEVKNVQRDNSEGGFPIGESE